MKKKLVSGIILTLLLAGMLTLIPNIQPAEASGIVYPRSDGSVERPTAEVLPITVIENVTILEDSSSQLALLINVPSSPLAEMYRRSLGAPLTVDVDEEIPIPENMTLQDNTDGNSPNTVFPVREEFYRSIEEQQQFSLGLAAKISDSVMVPRTSLNECRIWISAVAVLPIVNITKTNQYDRWEMALGPKNDDETKAVAGFMFTNINFVQLMLESLTGEQIYDLRWITRLALPKDSAVLTGDKIAGLNWKVDFGGGTFMSAVLSLDGASTIILDERTIITEQNIAAAPDHIYEAISLYKVFNVEYLMPHSPQTFEEIKHSVTSDDWSDDWSHTWEDQETHNFTRKYEHTFLNATLTVTKTLTISVHVAWDFDWNGVKMFESWMQLEATAELEFEAYANGSYTNTWTRKFFEWSHRFDFWVTGVPVWADLNFTATGSLTLSAYGELQVYAGATAYGSFKAGVRWTRESNWSEIKEKNMNTSRYGPTMEAEASLWIRAGLNCRLTFLFYSIAGPFIEFEPYATVTVTFDYPPPEVEWEITANLRIAAGATFAGWLKSLLGLDDWSNTLYDEQLKSWSDSWGPSSISITEMLNPSTTSPSKPVEVYGRATFSDGSAVPLTDVTVTIDETGDSWIATTDADGYYSKHITSPDSVDDYTVRVDISSGYMSGSNSKTLEVQSLDQPVLYILEGTTMCKGMQETSPYDPIDETESFRRNDAEAHAWVHLSNIYTSLTAKVKWYDPNGDLYWDSPPKIIPDQQGGGWKFSKLIWIDGHNAADLEGRWRAEIYVDEGNGYDLVAVEDFVIGYEVTGRTMAKYVQESSPWEPSDPTNAFLNTDPKAFGWIRYDELAESVELKWEWREPSGKIYFTWYNTTKDPADEGRFYYDWYKSYGYIYIYGHQPQSKLGQWEVRAFIKDVYGNWDLEYSEYFMISDNTPPGVPGTPVDDGVYSTNGTVIWTWTEASEDWIIVKYQVQVGTTLGGNDVFDGSVGIDLTKTLHDLPSGFTYYARVQAMNTVGQWGPWSDASDGITVDRPPATIIIEGPSGPIDYDDVFFRWTGSDDLTPIYGIAYSYYLEGYDSDWSPWTSNRSKQYNDLPFGYAYIFRVKAKDQLGNVDPTPANRPFIYGALYGYSGIMTGLVSLGGSKATTDVVKRVELSTIKRVALGIYWDSQCSNFVSLVEWGLTLPGSTKNVTLYLRNEGNVQINLFLTTSNWNPLGIADFITLGWDYDGEILNPNDIVEVTFILSVSGSNSFLEYLQAHDIHAFSFDIILELNERPAAMLSVDKNTVQVEETVIFDASGSADDGRIDYYFFDFDDGTNSSWRTPPVVTHKYVEEGTYNATLVVMDDYGVTSVGGELAYVEITVIPVITATVDIHPKTVALRSNGIWVTAYIELPQSYNLSDIDVSTILLNDTVPVDPFWVDKTLESVNGDYDADDIPDLMVKFDRGEVIEFVFGDTSLPNNKIIYVTLTLAGQFTDGTPFEGNDTIRIILPITDIY